ncbi:hypothetical protein Tco_0938673 [Tanacetum coccineum]|uniref:Uncharacterized protein n=1 Tax=Tanacetum coccineum TaxID=301880 RepID=A0ABQ5DJP6_9ASTR
MIPISSPLWNISTPGASGTFVVPVDPSPSPLVSANQPLGTALVVSNHSPKSAAALSTHVSVISKSNLSHPSGTGQSVVKIVRREENFCKIEESKLQAANAAL